MINIPVALYDNVFYNILLVFVVVFFLQSRNVALENGQNLRVKSTFGKVLLAFSIIFIGLRPITFSHFGDMGMYNIYFVNYLEGAPLVLEGKDIGFEIFMKLCSYVMMPQFFFLTIAFLYIFPFYTVSKKLFADYWFYGFFMLLISLSFWGAATNGLRNAVATSIFLFVFVTENKYAKFGIMLLAILFHKSMLIPTGAYLAAMYYQDTKTYFKAWFAAIPLSLALGGFWETLFLNLGFAEDEKLKNYLIENEDLVDRFSSSGFRWDFLLYSGVGVYAGWYFIYKRKFEDAVYLQLVNTYLITNAFWILVIRANFSNRFAFLSWFMLGLVIIYPMLKNKFFTKQHLIIGNIILCYFAFTYLLNIVLAKY
ncbi:EpsG family protein [Flavobacterium caeni]|uniref:EpsG family protein n=1 Tax=Flavobacterium caeni TaxID=490189 RepID=A0A1G5FIN4_9FLAO|nr:EpsG family protein [Flavobacterium caeni]SCY38984.1 EpsG family protein [Flavobacterium caeni]